MSIFLNTYLITSTPVETQLALCEFFFSAATLLFCLSAEAGYYPQARKYLAQYAGADYWIRRQRRKHFAYGHAMDIICLKVRSTQNLEPGKCPGKARRLQGPGGFYPPFCTGHG
jgi:hypothetical protein